LPTGIHRRIFRSGLERQNSFDVLIPAILVTENGCWKRLVKLSFVMRVLFFAQLQDVTGCAATELASPSPLNREQLWFFLLEKFPGLDVHRANVRLARNWEYADANTRFGDDDEVALIPPVSGG